MNTNTRENIKIGLEVLVVEKKNQKNTNLTQGVVKAILTNSPTHPHGIKVKLENGIVGRCKKIL